MNISHEQLFEYIPEVLTSQLEKFCEDCNKSQMLLLFLGISQSIVLKNQAQTEKEFAALFGISDAEMNEEGKRAFRENLKLSTYREIVFQMVYSRVVDNFLYYLKSIIESAIMQKPQMLASKKKTISLEYILGFEAYDELVHEILSDQVDKLFFSGINDITKFLKERANLVLCADDKMEILNKAIKTRNLIVHNRGFANKQFIAEFPDAGHCVDDFIETSYEDIENLLEFLGKLASEIDRMFISKFSLETIENPLHQQLSSQL